MRGALRGRNQPLQVFAILEPGLEIISQSASHPPSVRLGLEP